VRQHRVKRWDEPVIRGGEVLGEDPDLPSTGMKFVSPTHRGTT